MSEWTEERRQAQRELIIRVKPWLKSTGAKTPEGKAISAMNAYKGGLRQELRRLVKESNDMLKEQREAIKRV
ncbi:hypothetical protein [Aquirhabdus parva]|uniref:Uncharacterized protein n=1 Tax=Aquirhabdus parva TaxID=2283318 RepID=A0A345P5P3_9GAMM|nr:hypothetical protein [Aquirhabdus parva]AXI02602.1 hypothetical protein HYN46_07035 [Aquirhabdus parva]